MQAFINDITHWICSKSIDHEPIQLHVSINAIMKGKFLNYELIEFLYSEYGHTFVILENDSIEDIINRFKE